MLQFIVLPQSEKIVSGKRVESKIRHITKKKVMIKFHPNTLIFLLGLVEYYQLRGYLTSKQYYYLDKYYTIARENF